MAPLREKKKQRRHERIMDVALDAFNSKGILNTTMLEIADRAELAVGTLYNYFPSKNALLIGIMEQKMRASWEIDVQQIVDLYHTENDPGAVVKWLVLEVVRKILVLTKQNWQEMLSALFSSSSRAELDQGIGLDMEAVGKLERTLHHLQRRGLIRNDARSYAMAIHLYSLISFQFLTYVFLPQMAEEDLLSGISRQIDLAFEGIGGDRRPSVDSGRDERAR